MHRASEVTDELKEWFLMPHQGTRSSNISIAKQRQYYNETAAFYDERVSPMVTLLGE
jgi:hypothetical protein